jgi:Protein of unknown function (DUF3489)
MNASDKPAVTPAKEEGTRPRSKPPSRASKPRSQAIERRTQPTSKTSKKTAVAQPGSKTAKILALLQRPGGASLQELKKATGWQPHSVRGFLSGVLKKKMGLHVRSVARGDDERTYRVLSK